MAIIYHTVRDDGYGGASGEIDVRAVSTNPDHEHSDEYPIAELSMSPAKEEPNFTIGSASANGRVYYNTTKVDPRYPRNNPGQYNPTELFTHISPQIRGAYSDPRMRHTLPTMVGIAMHGLNAANDLPMADSSLTNFSSALSRNAVKRGLAVPHPSNPDMESAGGYESIPKRTTMDLDPKWMTAVSDADVSAARHWVRSKIRGRDTNAPKQQVSRGDSQFEQLNLGI